MDPATPKRPSLRSVLGDQVKDHLLQAILTGRYAPGARIVETQVARELGVSQSPVREALRDLAALGIVESSAFRGARVRRPTSAELLEAVVVRTELEVLAARLAVTHLDDEDLEQLADFIEQMKQAAAEGDRHAEAMADAAFHNRMVELAGNAVLQRMWQTMEPFSRTYITTAAGGADQHQIAELHPPVLEALRSRDPERAMRAVRRHFEQAAAMLDDHDAARRPSPAAARGRPGRKRAAT